MNYVDSIRLQKGLFELLMGFAADRWVTLTFNLDYSYEAAKMKLKRFHAYLDHLQLGKRWCQSTDRTRFIAIAEFKGGTLHYHLLLKLPAHPRTGFDFNKTGRTLWKQITPAGTFDVKPIKTYEDHWGFADYTTKTAWCFNTQENFVMSSEFVGDRNGRKESVSR